MGLRTYTTCLYPDFLSRIQQIYWVRLRQSVVWLGLQIYCHLVCSLALFHVYRNPNAASYNLQAQSSYIVDGFLTLAEELLGYNSFVRMWTLVSRFSNNLSMCF
ncbi:hypothetical protein KC19_1G200300 [Ceratodon purpureus]|uniref:Uncharacterized protein n=1 Tax=Ceratodon purpureus TaxID=3225 RepID=A0A8T0J925_CERPU|nr:hypothetical protein KC19_1G200300 [Ceratodon purpureus]